MPLITVNVPPGEGKAFRKKVAAMGYAVVAKAVDAPVEKKAEKPKKRKLTSVQQGFVDGYREMVEADKGGKPLLTSEEFFTELNKAQENHWGTRL